MCRAPVVAAQARVTSPDKKSTNGYAEESKSMTVMNRPLQLFFVLALVVPLALGATVDAAGFQNVRRWTAETFATMNVWSKDPLFVAAFLCLCVERACYTWVWVFTGHFERFCTRLEKLGYKDKGETPVDVVVRFFWVNKFFQYTGFGAFYLLNGPLFPFKPSPFGLLNGLSLVVVGQVLNAGIYRAIGKNGVYYGCKFNQNVPWCTGFPFNVVTAHPQYLGSVFTTFGAALALATEHHVKAGWFGLAIAQAALYLYMAYVEHHL
mmetsp:Transcript_2108/g.7127  ORF Transcript_2108/g.7127 Transcript_2108/m.7127 type:complete len:265 (-) Transcript_2108:383-1177(-)|eukprot:CAMPEP_0118910750 /NCGR_PEP_ID=MMETSP1166-20130328/12754_1 /TAXON_ID=1104430 /ORGANISM="Chrysoreinhardia sp, Strain CCMP3193" /LENGTH=264 /DNA_ID=CAMNT_0006850221 /DNA_START=55 /DNA_END=849 /DNA_ORIENTATION=-